MSGSKRGDEVSVGDATITHVATPRAATVVRRLELEVTDGPKSGLRFSTDTTRCAIGSHPRCDLVIDDPTVSRFHCEIHIDDQGARVRDMGSRNGTSVDGVGVVEAHLRAGSKLQLGRTTVRVGYGNEPAQIALSEHEQFGLMVGASVAMRATFAILEKAAKSDATVLLEGETGTGKTIAAKSLHQNGERAKGPFVIVDCGAIPANLLDSELFGHERGAFTGADARRTGAFEDANGGTLFLDEIGELPLDLQPKLLGVLEERTVRRLGSTQTHSIDVRVIAATNRDLREEVNAGRFRSDLYYRLAVIKISQPPLRDRRDDLPALAERILLSLGADRPRVDAMLRSELHDRLVSSSWPGNVRELRNYLERCLVFEEIVPLGDGAGVAAGGAPVSYAHLPYADARQTAINEFERAYLQQLLARHERVADAAADAGIDRTYFYRLLRRHGLNT